MYLIISKYSIFYTIKSNNSISRFFVTNAFHKKNFCVFCERFCWRKFLALTLFKWTMYNQMNISTFYSSYPPFALKLYTLNIWTNMCKYDNTHYFHHSCIWSMVANLSYFCICIKECVNAFNVLIPWKVLFMHKLNNNEMIDGQFRYFLKNVLIQILFLLVTQ